MKTLLATIFLVLMGALPGFGDEVAVADVKLLGRQAIPLDKYLFVGDTNSVFPDHIEVEIHNNDITSIVAIYPKETSLIDLKNAISKQLGLPTKKFAKESGSWLYEWREESSHVTALFSEKSERDQCPMVIISYVGKN